jgi:ketosteroid isomerase-like protein
MEDSRIALMRRVFEGWKRRDFDALLELTHPDIFARVVLPPGEAKRAYRGREEILAFLHDGDDKYEQCEAEPRTFTVGPTGRVLAEGSVSYKGRDTGGIASVAYWVCEVRDGRSSGGRPSRSGPMLFRRPASRLSRALRAHRLTAVGVGLGGRLPDADRLSALLEDRLAELP